MTKVTITSPDKRVEIEGNEDLSTIAQNVVYVFNNSVFKDDMDWLDDEYLMQDLSSEALSVVHLNAKKTELEQAVEEYRENPKTWPEGLYVGFDDNYWGEIMENDPNKPDEMSIRYGVDNNAVVGISISKAMPRLYTYKNILGNGVKSPATFEAYCNWNGIKTF